MTPRRAASGEPVYAVIDIGTNSTKLLVARSDGVHIEPVYFDRRTTRIGERLARDGFVSGVALSRTANAVRDLARAASRRGASHIVAVGTYAFRAARNGDHAARRIARVAGIDVRILGGREEAEMSFASARARLERPRAATVLIDVGGGSTEFVIARGARVLTARSLPLGALRLTERHIHSDPIDPDEFRRLEREVEIGVRRVTQPVARVARGADLIASGGSATTAFDMVHGTTPGRSGIHATARLRLGDLRRLQSECLSKTLADRKRMPGLPPDRADIVPAGIAVVLAFMTAMRKRVLTVSGGGVREGVILRMARAEAPMAARTRRGRT
jgi:exopolyphosphatase / guanosine-5'-triphosphate,3'-diphosphate pyrophosphatase